MQFRRFLVVHHTLKSGIESKPVNVQASGTNGTCNRSDSSASKDRPNAGAGHQIGGHRVGVGMAPGQGLGFGLSLTWCGAIHTPCTARRESLPAPLSAGHHSGAHGPQWIVDHRSRAKIAGVIR